MFIVLFWAKNIVSKTVHTPLSPSHICLFILAQNQYNVVQITIKEIEEINVNPVLNFALKANFTVTARKFFTLVLGIFLLTETIVSFYQSSSSILTDLQVKSIDNLLKDIDCDNINSM